MSPSTQAMAMSFGPRSWPPAPATMAVSGMTHDSSTHVTTLYDIPQPRSCIVDGTDIVCVGYAAYAEPGFKFVADEGRPFVARLDKVELLSLMLKRNRLMVV